MSQTVWPSWPLYCCRHDMWVMTRSVHNTLHAQILQRHTWRLLRPAAAVGFLPALMRLSADTAWTDCHNHKRRRRTSTGETEECPETAATEQQDIVSVTPWQCLLTFDNSRDLTSFRYSIGTKGKSRIVCTYIYSRDKLPQDKDEVVPKGNRFTFTLKDKYDMYAF